MKAAPKKWIAIVALAVLAGFLAFHRPWDRRPPQQQADELFQQAALLATGGDLSKAESLAREALKLDDGLVIAYRLVAECAAARGDYEQALNDLSHITDGETDDWLIARQLAADMLHNRVHRFQEAERAYLDVLAAKPDDVLANEGYARLLGLCGRRREAIPHVLRLVRAGRDTDLLMLLARESGALSDPEMLQSARKADPRDPNPLLGQAQAADSAQDAPLALQKLREASSLNGLPADFHGRMGRQLLTNRRFDECDAWIRNISAAPVAAECWLVQAELAERAHDRRGAIRCFWEAAKLRPESLHANNQLARKLTLESQLEQAEPFFERVRQLNEFRDLQRRAIMSNQQPSFADVLRMIQAYQSVGRLWEAFAWGRSALEVEPNNPELRKTLQEIGTQLSELPLELTARKYNPAHQIDLSHYPVPSFGIASTVQESGSTSSDISFHQQRAEIGFDFQYSDGTRGTTRRMFEFAGGGMAVVDFDNDGAPDLFCTQGRAWGTPGSGAEKQHDRLFHNQLGRSFREISESAGLMPDTGFGQGASAGDVNNDGFTDLYVANTGTNTLWLNNGDGTFTDHSASLADQTAQWTTSCLVADLNGDSIPDLYDVNYLTGDDVFDRVCVQEHGEKIMCAPYDFHPAMDRVWLGDGEGGFRDQTTEFLNPPPNGKGLGIVAMNIGDDRLSLFVANDTTANFFYTADSPDATSLTETALTAGLAFNGDGKAEACMGIAVADCTQDGRLDLLVTNFLHESNTLYSPIDERVFGDRTRELGLHDATLPVLGFGTQFLDANLDGRFELFVANGYTQDLSKYNTPYKMRPQLFEWSGQGFQQVVASRLGGWSEAEAVGRAVARLDWNLDGKPDLAVGLLDAPSFVLTNTSRAADSHYLKVQLVGRETARDAIGTAIAVKIGESNWSHQLTAGDGYQCSNERRIHIGCGPFSRIARLTVVWPSGAKQEFNDVPTSQAVTLIEGHELIKMN
ncbi:MAG: hypothetical protein CMJ48_05610 [Planctomycetaceae bacterium]|nr:hypothetical protein [Planctomycetaceae bacterium]